MAAVGLSFLIPGIVYFSLIELIIGTVLIGASTVGVIVISINTWIYASKRMLSSEVALGKDLSFIYKDVKMQESFLLNDRKRMEAEKY